MTTIPDIIQHVEEVLATSKELMDEGDSHNVALILNSFLHILIRDLEALHQEQGSRDVLLNGLGEQIKPQSTRMHMDCGETVCLVGTPDRCPHHRTPPKAMTKAAPQQPGIPPPKVSKTKRPVTNKYPGKCATCGTWVSKKEGFVLPADSSNATRKWHTFCTPHYNQEIAR